MAIPAMEASLDATTDKAADLQRFIERARQVTRLTELTPEIVHEFIEKIVVSKPNTVDGKRHQRVDVHYNTIGLWCAPSPEEMEKLFQEHLAGQHKKTASPKPRRPNRSLVFYGPALGQLPYGSCPNAGGLHFREKREGGDCLVLHLTRLSYQALRGKCWTV